MIESIFQLKWVVSRHQQAPLLKEREQFLAHCQQQGTPRSQLGRNKAGRRANAQDSKIPAPFGARRFERLRQKLELFSDQDCSRITR
jgi:hypothetical protein